MTRFLTNPIRIVYIVAYVVGFFQNSNLLLSNGFIFNFPACTRYGTMFVQPPMKTTDNNNNNNSNSNKHKHKKNKYYDNNTRTFLSDERNNRNNNNNNNNAINDDTMKGVIELGSVDDSNDDDGTVSVSSSTITKEKSSLSLSSSISAPFLSQGDIDPQTLNPDLSDPKQARVILYIIISLVPVLFLIPLMLGSRELIPLEVLPPVQL